MDKLACCCLGIMVGSEWGGLEERWRLSFSSLSPPDLIIISLLRADWYICVDRPFYPESVTESFVTCGWGKMLHFAWVPKMKVLFKG